MIWCGWFRTPLPRGCSARFDETRSLCQADRRRRGRIGAVRRGTVPCRHAWAALSWARTAASPQERAAHRATLDRYCVDCHSRAILEAGLNLEELDTADLEKNGVVWEKMIRKLRNRQMPPPACRGPTPRLMPRSSSSSRADAIGWPKEAQSRPPHAASAQSHGICQRHARSACAGDRRRGALAGR